MFEQERFDRHLGSRVRSIQRCAEHTNLTYRDENEDLILRVRDYVEKAIVTRNYGLIFHRITTVCEEKDLAIQHHISSLHWTTTPMLDAVLNESLPHVVDALYKAINGIE